MKTKIENLQKAISKINSMIKLAKTDMSIDVKDLKAERRYARIRLKNLQA
tara:strand:- start:910 stop:1059 length:150 start_codon:yes stop_codon:yes gene_type:complete